MDDTEKGRRKNTRVIERKSRNLKEKNMMSRYKNHNFFFNKKKYAELETLLVHVV